MAVTVQQVLDGAKAASIANKAGLGTLTTREILERANFAQQELHTKLAHENRYFYAAKVTQASTGAGPGGRTVNLAALAPPPLERLLAVYLPSGLEVNGVDASDLEADLAPRYYQLGSVLYEVASDWAAAAGAVTLTLLHVTRPAELDLTASDLSQPLAIPDRFARYYELDLGLYLANKDWARSKSHPDELKLLIGERDEVYQTMLTFLDHYSGATRRRFDYPVPTNTEKA